MGDIGVFLVCLLSEVWGFFGFFWVIFVGWMGDVLGGWG